LSIKLDLIDSLMLAQKFGTNLELYMGIIPESFIKEKRLLLDSTVSAGQQHDRH
jgi:hypothetical protein